MAKKSQVQTQPQVEMTLKKRKLSELLWLNLLLKPMNPKQKRDAFKVYWTQNKKKYGMTGKLEHVLWLHLVATKNDEPANFEAGLKNFGIKKV